MFLSRRDFMKFTGVSIGSALLSQITKNSKILASPSNPAAPGNQKAMLYDASKCVACHSCERACKEANNLPIEENEENHKELSGNTWTVVKAIEADDIGEKVQLYRKFQCMHCTEASCEAVCPTGSISHQGEAVIIDQDWCIGCAYCVQACPFNIPHKDEHIGTARKCILCADRTARGLEPACVEACPQHAVVYGDRASLIAEGKARVQYLISNCVKNANLYGTTQLGGLAVMYVLLDSPEVYGLPKEPQLATTNTPAKWLGGIITAGLIAVFPFWFIFRRRDELHQESNKKIGE